MPAAHEPELTRPRRFYEQVNVTQVADRFVIQLDGRPPKTPGQATLAAPTEALALLLAEEWDAQQPMIDYGRMPAVRLAFTTLDQVARARAAVAAEIAAYAGSDVICYLAEAPADLAEAEAAVWGPWIDWAGRALGVELTAFHGVIHQAQPDAAVDRIKALALAEDDFVLSGLSFATALYGSAVLAFAVWRGAADAVEALDISQFDETFQMRRWGVDAEAAARRRNLEAEAAMIGRWFAALRR